MTPVPDYLREFIDAHVVWETESPTCFSSDATLLEKIDSFPMLVVDLPGIPTLISGDVPPGDIFMPAEEDSFDMVFDLGLSREGVPEIITSVDSGHVDSELLAAEYVKGWVFDMPFRSRNAMCLHIRLTVQVNFSD